MNFGDWCHNKHLALNISKTKEIVFQKKKVQTRFSRHSWVLGHLTWPDSISGLKKRPSTIIVVLTCAAFSILSDLFMFSALVQGYGFFFLTYPFEFLALVGGIVVFFCVQIYLFEAPNFVMQIDLSCSPSLKYTLSILYAFCLNP